jgi:endonuclease/exonuclease/phosphatase family metal-dependent hydrolase
MSRRNFRVGTFNLCNLALPNINYYRNTAYSPETYQQKKRWTALQLNRMRADLVGFQEVFHPKALQEVLQQSDYCREFKLIAADPVSDTPMVAFASRLPILEHHYITEFPATARLDVQRSQMPFTHFSRPVLSVRLQLTEAIECTVFVVHLKSKRPIFPDDADRDDPVEIAKGQARSLMLRAAESIALRVLLMQVLQHSSYPVIVLGDMNDGGTAVTSQIISGQVPHRRLDPDRKRKIWDVLLYHVKDIQARQSYGDFYYTHIHNGHYDSLDHIMVSQEFVTQNPERVGRVVYVSLFNDHLIDETLSNEEVPDWQSDHGQVVASIDLEHGVPERSNRFRRTDLSIRQRTEVRQQSTRTDTQIRMTQEES